jgi:hypothetical protein
MTRAKERNGRVNSRIAREGLRMNVEAEMRREGEGNVVVPSPFER